VQPAAGHSAAEAPAPVGQPARTPEPQPFPAEPSAADATAAPPVPPAPAAGGSGNHLSLVDVRRLWPDIVDATKLKRRVTWIHLTQHAQVVAVDDKTLTLGFGNAGARESFVNGGSPEIVRQAAIDVVGADWRVEAIVDPGATPGGQPPAPAPSTPASTGAPAAPPEVREPGPARADAAPEPGAPGADPQASIAPASEAPSEPPAWATDDGGPTAEPSAAASATPSATASAEVTRAAREAIAPTRGPGTSTEAAPRVDVDAEAHRDDPDVETSGLAGAELLQRELGAQIIHEIKHD
jgi:DNA polymerase-3 subunit gamma/tau